MNSDMFVLFSKENESSGQAAISFVTEFMGITGTQKNSNNQNTAPVVLNIG